MFMDGTLRKVPAAPSVETEATVQVYARSDKKRSPIQTGVRACWNWKKGMN